jgi:acyl-CoA thioesterase-2
VGTGVDELLALLDLRPAGEGRFRAPGVVSERSRLYGGHVLAQATMAAGLVVEDARVLHSTHAYFLSSGVATASIDYEVTPLRESGSFTICTVRAEQGDRTLLQLTASFHVEEEGPSLERAAPAVPGPEVMAPADDWMLAQPDEATHRHLPYFADAFELRQSTESVTVDPVTGRASLGAAERDIWIRARDHLPDVPVLHAAAIAYISDKPALGTTVLGPPLHGDPVGHQVASLDHSMWFHRPCRADEWLLFHCDTATAGGARAFARMEVYAGGSLAVSATQEGLVRPLHTRP